MDHIFAPWRRRYIDHPPAPEACVFCRLLAEADGPANGVLARGPLCAVVLNAFPYTAGHLMIVPLAHAAWLGELSAEARREMIDLAARVEAILQAEYRPQGFNLGFNLGEAAGAGIAGHLHFHVVPRWRGDVNFITAIGETRVLPEELAVTWARLRPHFVA